jgi:hypothetical protein
MATNKLLGPGEQLRFGKEESWERELIKSSQLHVGWQAGAAASSGWWQYGHRLLRPRWNREDSY